MSNLRLTSSQVRLEYTGPSIDASGTITAFSARYPEDNPNLAALGIPISFYWLLTTKNATGEAMVNGTNRYLNIGSVAPFGIRNVSFNPSLFTSEPTYV